MLLLLLACGSECPPNAIEKDGECVVIEDTGAPDDSGDSAGESGETGESGESGETEDSGETADSGEEAACVVTGVTASPLGEPVNNQLVHVTLHSPGTVEVACRLASGEEERTTVLASGATWAYWDDASVAAGWSDVGFDDSAWATGPSPFGFGEAVDTTIDFGGNKNDKHITSWYRKTFTVADPSTATEALLTLEYDDGAVVYLNGVELGRWNLPSGALTADTETTASVEPTTATLSFDPALLVAGENLLAVELHQSSPTTSDAWLDAQLALVAPSGEKSSELVVPDPVYGRDVYVPVRGLLADASYRCTATPSCGPAASFGLTTDPLPSGLPTLDATGEMPTPGYVLFSVQRPCTGSSQMYLVMVDPEGNIRWYEAADGVLSSFSTDVEVAWTSRGQILWGGGSEPLAIPHVDDLDGTTVYLADYPGVDDDVYHHDVEWTEDDTIVGLVESTVSTDGGSFPGFDLVEHDPATGAVTWSWSGQAAYDAGWLEAADNSDPWHPNAFATLVDAEGPAVYVGLYTAHQMIRIDRATGEVSWSIGRGRDFRLLDESGNPASDDDWFLHTHGLSVIDENHVMLYDNGNETTRSRVVEYELDLAARTATLVYSWGDGFYNPNWGDADLLEDGNVLVNQSATTCTGGDDVPGNLLIVERASDEVAWRATFRSQDDSSYRAQWIDACEVFGNRKFCVE